MRIRHIFFPILIVFTAALVGCGAGSFFQTSPDGGERSWRKVAVFPAEAGGNAEAGAAVEAALVELMTANKLEVTMPPVLSAKLSARDLQRTVGDYTRKLYILNFSDPELSKQIGEALEIDAFVLPKVEYWGYSKKEGDKDIAKIGIGLILIEAKTGRVLWRGVKYETREYLLLKPPLAGVARDLLKKMVNEMLAAREKG